MAHGGTGRLDAHAAVPLRASNCILPIPMVTRAASSQPASRQQGPELGRNCVDAYTITSTRSPPSIRSDDHRLQTHNRPSNGLPLGPPMPTTRASTTGPPRRTTAAARQAAVRATKLPNAPQYPRRDRRLTMPLPNDWMLTCHGDYHYQSESWARVFNSDPYDRIKAFSTSTCPASSSTKTPAGRSWPTSRSVRRDGHHRRLPNSDAPA